MKLITALIYFVVIFFQACSGESSHRTSQKIIINEIVTQNTYTFYDKDYFEFNDWIELFNDENIDINLSGYTISDSKEKKYKFPDGAVIHANNYLVIWADGKDHFGKEIHLDFKLSSDGGEITLLSPDGNIADTLKYGQQERDVSFGKSVNSQTNGYMLPTPGAQNSKVFTSLVRAPKPQFVQKSGFYDEFAVLEFQNMSQEETIYYTLDGSRPTRKSLRYTAPVIIEKTTVVSAVDYSNLSLPSERVTRSYFINENSTLPVVSMTIEPAFLYDDEIGIYAVGTNGADVYSWCQGPRKANYFQDWERAAYFEYFETDRTLGFSIAAGVKIAGSCSQALPQKSFTVKIKNKYGQDILKYKLFKDRAIDEFKYFSLRNSGNDWCNTMLRDAFMQSLVQEMNDVSIQAYQPSLLFINGKYWGLYNVREKMNEKYIQSHFNTKKIDLLENDRVVKEGNAEEYSALLDYVKNHNLSYNEHYDYVSSKIDIEQFIDYFISEIYFANGDWPGNNIFYWKEQNDSAGWRWILHDTDFGFDLKHTEAGANYNMLEMATSDDGPYWPNPPWSTFLLRNLLLNDGFRDHFIKQSLMRLDSTFESSRVKSVLDNLSSAIQPEIQRQFDRWSSVDIPEDLHQRYPAFKTIEQWYGELERMKDFADARVCFVKEHFKDKFYLDSISCGNNSRIISH